MVQLLGYFQKDFLRGKTTGMLILRSELMTGLSVQIVLIRIKIQKILHHTTGVT